MENKRVLFLAASPSNEVRVGFDAEYREIKRVLKQSTLREQFEFELSLAIRIEDIQQAILEFKPHVIHFSGHGEKYELAFSNGKEKADWIDIEMLRGLFEIIAPHVECVVLNACYSETQAEIIAQYVDYAIGMEIAIEDKAAIAFSTGFYTALFNGDDYETAYKQGKEAICLAGLKDQVDIPKQKKRQKTFIPTFKHDIFVSFADVDKEWAKELTDYLRKKIKSNLNIFEDDFQIYEGNNETELEHAAILLVIASSDYKTELKSQNKIIFVEKELCNPRPAFLKGYIPTKFWRYDDISGMQYLIGAEYYNEADKLAHEVSESLTKLKSQYQHQEQTAQKMQQLSELKPGSHKNIDMSVFLYSTKDDLLLTQQIEAFLLEKYGIYCAVAIEAIEPESKPKEIRDDRTNNMLNCDGVLIIYENGSLAWARFPLSDYRTIKSLREKEEKSPLKIIAVHKRQGKNELGIKTDNLKVYNCPPEHLEKYLEDFVEELTK